MISALSRAGQRKETTDSTDVVGLGAHCRAQDSEGVGVAYRNAGVGRLPHNTNSGVFLSIERGVGVRKTAGGSPPTIRWHPWNRWFPFAGLRASARSFANRSCLARRGFEAVVGGVDGGHALGRLLQH